MYVYVWCVMHGDMEWGTHAGPKSRGTNHHMRGTAGVWDASDRTPQRGLALDWDISVKELRSDLLE